jgi:sporulation protein YlmC with PRC-barrel domain
MENNKNKPYTEESIFDLSDNSSLVINPTNYYKIDFDKVKTIKDIKLILSALQIAFSESYENFEDIKHLLKEED